MKYILLSLILIGGIAISLIVLSDSAKPGDALYFIDRGLEPLEVAFVSLTNGPIGKADKYLSLAEERLEELNAVVEGDTSALSSKAYAQEETNDPEKSENIDQLLTDYDEHIENAIIEAGIAQDEGEDADEVLEEIVDASLDQQETLMDVYGKVPLEDRDSIMLAIGNCEQKQEKAMNAISNQYRETVREKVETKLKSNGEKKESLQMNKDEAGNSDSDNDQGNGSSEPTNGGQPEDAGENGQGGQPSDSGNSDQGGPSSNGGGNTNGGN